MQMTMPGKAVIWAMLRKWLGRARKRRLASGPFRYPRTMFLGLFESCNFQCRYCDLNVKDRDALKPFRDKAYLDRICEFFDHFSMGKDRWRVILTGGEPFLAPNFNYLCQKLTEAGHEIAIYTNLSVPFDTHGWCQAVPPARVSYLMAAFHAAHYRRPDEFVARLEKLKAGGYPVIARLVGAPENLSWLPWLKSHCDALQVSLMATCMLESQAGARVPAQYTPAEFDLVARHTVGYSSLLQLEGGLVVRDKVCTVGERMFFAALHAGGAIRPCISVEGPTVGNIFTKKLTVLPGPHFCLQPQQRCTCDVYTQQGIVTNADDRSEFERIKQGHGRNCRDDFERWKQARGLVTVHMLQDEES